MRIRTGKKDFLWNYAGTVFRMGASFLIVPFLLHFLTSDQLGLWYAFGSVSGFVLTFQSGFAPTFARNVTYCWSGARELSRTGVSVSDGAEVDWRLFAELVAACKSVYRVISVVVLAVIGIVGTAYVLYISSGLPVRGVAVPWGIYCLAAFLNVYFTYYESLLRGVGHFPAINKATIASSSLNIVLSVVLLVSGMELMACSVAYLVQGLTFRLLCRRYFYSYESISAKLAAVAVGKDGVKQLEAVVSLNAFKDTAVSVANYAVSGSVTILCSLFIDLTSTGYYSVALQVINAAVGLSAVILTTYQPSIQSAASRGDVAEQRRLMSRTLAGMAFLYLVLMVAAVAFILPFLTLFRSGLSFDYPLVAALSAYMFLWRQHSACAAFIASSNELPYVGAFVVSGVAGVALSVAFVLILDLGIYGIVAGQALAQLAYNNWKWPMEAAKRVGATYRGMMVLGFREWMADARSIASKRR